MVQRLHDADYEERMTVCQDFIERIEADEQFLSNIIFSDEATFHTSGKA